MIGELNRRITLYKREEVANGRGGFAFNYVDAGNFWAGIMPLSQVEINKYKEADIETNARLVMRYNPSSFKRPKAGDRIGRGFLTYEVVGVVDNISNGDYLEILAVTL